MNGGACINIGGHFQHLDERLNPSDRKKCEQLCSAIGQKGCCFLDISGCHWKTNSESTPNPAIDNPSNYRNASATSCRTSKILVYLRVQVIINEKLQNYRIFYSYFFLQF